MPPVKHCLLHQPKMATQPLSCCSPLPFPMRQPSRVLLSRAVSRLAALCGNYGKQFWGVVQPSQCGDTMPQRFLGLPVKFKQWRKAGRPLACAILRMSGRTRLPYCSHWKAGNATGNIIQAPLSWRIWCGKIMQGNGFTGGMMRKDFCEWEAFWRYTITIWGREKGVRIYEKTRLLLRSQWY